MAAGMPACPAMPIEDVSMIPCSRSLCRRGVVQTLVAQTLVALTLAALLAITAGCGGADSDAQQPPARGGEGGRSPGGRTLPTAPVAVAPAAIGTIASHYGATASLEAQKSVEVLARVEGVVGELRAEEGDRVDADAVLLVIDNPAISYRVDQAAARTAQLEAAFRRLEQMHAEDLASEEELEVARADYDDARAAEGLTRLDRAYTRVTAPFAGVVTERLVDPGQMVSTNQAVFRLVDVTPLRARVHVPSREFRELKVDQEVELVLDSTGDHLVGTIELISPVIDPTSGTIKVTVEVPEYPRGTRPGDFAEVRIVTERRDSVVLVPRVAVVTEKGATAVYVAVSGDGETGTVAERRPVEVGFTDDEEAQIVSGVAAAELVVVKGQRSLENGQPLRILEGPGAETAAAAADTAGPGGPGGPGGRGGRGGGGRGR